MIRRSDPWLRLDPSEFPRIAAELGTGAEWEYTTLTERLRRRNSAGSLLHLDSRLIFQDRGGFTFVRNTADGDYPSPRLSRAPRSIIGLTADVQGFCQSLRLEPEHMITYQLLRRPPSEIPLSLPAGITALPLAPQDHGLVLPLETAYQREEVLLPGHLLDNAAVSIHLDSMLENQIGVGILKGRSLVSKAHTNARGITCNQIGGVYTVPAFRGQGYARQALQALLQRIDAEHMTSSLFVKSANAAGLHLYRTLGFLPAGRYAIAYT